ncbi:hypothetical protein VPH35_079078 [Triticum aestivum]|uniref:Remorin C-terminal domain-containing protein n=2 Tax=Triticum aestivum TaxID=4565 RepID=A0A3B6JLV4_WHEAT|nr:remorin 1.4-like isoform X1 [Triticum aestivum]
MDSDSKALRVQFSGVEKRDKGSREASTILPQENSAPGRAQMDSGDEYNAIFAATIAAAAYAIAAEEEKQKASPVQPPTKRGESMRKPTGGSKISRWFSAKERAEDADEGPANISVRRPLKPEQRKPGGTGSDQKVPLPLPPKMHDSSVGAKKAPGSSRKSPEKKGSKRFEQEQAVQRVPTAVRPATSYQSRQNDDGTAGVTTIAGTQTKADAWEKERLARVREEYEKMMETIAEWETEKKVKAKRQKEQKEVALDRKRAKQLAEYNQEMTRINKIAGGARSMAGERKYEDEKKIREKAKKIRSTGKSPRGCCF